MKLEKEFFEMIQLISDELDVNYKGIVHVLLKRTLNEYRKLKCMITGMRFDDFQCIRYH